MNVFTVMHSSCESASFRHEPTVLAALICSAELATLADRGGQSMRASELALGENFRELNLRASELIQPRNVNQVNAGNALREL
jgi:hypothetical protein